MLNFKVSLLLLVIAKAEDVTVDCRETDDFVVGDLLVDFADEGDSRFFVGLGD